MKILILGATGRTGKWLIRKALEKGFLVNVLVRDKSSLETLDRLNLFIGSPLDKELLAQAMTGCDAVISSLNISRTSDFPWARLRASETFLSDVASHLISLAPETGVNRFVICSAWGTRETKQHIPFWFRWLIDTSNIGVAYRDHEKQEDLWEKSALNWTLVRPVGLTDQKITQGIRITKNRFPRPNLTISRASLAKFMLEIIEDADTYRTFPVISAE